jgi:tRNA modification GTPase
MLDCLAKAMAQVTLARKQIEQRGLGGRPGRRDRAGRPNAGKSSLFNALVGGPLALVSPQPGTTRDYLSRRFDVDGVPIELIDTAGWQQALDPISEQAQSLGREQSAQADLVLLCLEACQVPNEEESAWLARPGPPLVLALATKCDLAPPRPGLPATSATQKSGLPALRALLAQHARAHSHPPLAPSLSRCRHHVEACLGHLRQAHAAVLYQDPAEILALELRGALDELGAMVGAVYTDDLLDRIFSRFCIGK